MRGAVYIVELGERYSDAPAIPSARTTVGAFSTREKALQVA